jgi:hypothetical protein
MRGTKKEEGKERPKEKGEKSLGEAEGERREEPPRVQS